MKAIIPTGGRGTRMRPITFSSNKHFVPVANKPLIFYPIETIAKLGIKNVAITYNPGGLDEVKSFLGNGSKWGLKFSYVLQENPVGGVADIARVCEDFIGKDSFVFHLGDNIFTEGLNKAFKYFTENKPNGLVVRVHHPENKRLGVPYFEGNKLLRYVEKPENPPHDFAIPGVYFADSNFFRCFKEDPIKPSARGEYEIPDAFQWMIDHGLAVDIVEYTGKWLDPGKFDDWLESNQYVLDKILEGRIESELSSDTKIENRVGVGRNCTIENSHLRGPILIGDNVVIKNSYIGPFTSINNNCVIEDSHIENSVLMTDVKISKIHQPIDTSLIGTASEISNSLGPTASMKLFIGEKCKIQT